MRVRPRRSASAKPSVRSLGKAVEAGFRNAAAQAVREAHQAGVPVSVTTEDGRVAWLYPDGSVRPDGP